MTSSTCWARAAAYSRASARSAISGTSGSSTSDADAFAHVGAAGLAGDQRVVAGPLDGGTQQPHLGGLARPVAALEGDEQPGPRQRHVPGVPERQPAGVVGRQHPVDPPPRVHGAGQRDQAGQDEADAHAADAVGHDPADLPGLDGALAEPAGVGDQALGLGPDDTDQQRHHHQRGEQRRADPGVERGEGAATDGVRGALLQDRVPRQERHPAAIAHDEDRDARQVQARHQRRDDQRPARHADPRREQLLLGQPPRQRAHGQDSGEQAEADDGDEHAEADVPGVDDHGEQLADGDHGPGGQERHHHARHQAAHQRVAGDELQALLELLPRPGPVGAAGQGAALALHRAAAP